MKNVTMRVRLFRAALLLSLSLTGMAACGDQPTEPEVMVEPMMDGEVETNATGNCWYVGTKLVCR